MTLIITVLLTLIIASILFLIMRWVKTPWYRVDATRMREVIEMVLTGQARETDWAMAFNMTIRHDSELEAIRERCSEIEELYFTDTNQPYLFKNEGLKALKAIREELLLLESSSDKE